MEGLAHSHVFKQRLMNCEPIDISRFVVDLRAGHLQHWFPFSNIHPRECNSKRATYHRWSALPSKEALATQSPYSLLRYMFLDFPHHVLRSMARFRLRVHTLRLLVTYVRVVIISRMSSMSSFTAHTHM